MVGFALSLLPVVEAFVFSAPGGCGLSRAPLCVVLSKYPCGGNKVVVGSQTIGNLRDLHADKTFLGTDDLTFSHGTTTANLLEAKVNRAMVKAASEVIVVADSSKIDVIGPHHDHSSEQDRQTGY